MPLQALKPMYPPAWSPKVSSWLMNNIRSNHITIYHHLSLVNDQRFASLYMCSNKKKSWSSQQAPWLESPCDPLRRSHACCHQLPNWPASDLPACCEQQCWACATYGLIWFEFGNGSSVLGAEVHPTNWLFRNHPCLSCLGLYKGRLHPEGKLHLLVPKVKDLRTTGQEEMTVWWPVPHKFKKTLRKVTDPEKNKTRNSKAAPKQKSQLLQELIPKKISRQFPIFFRGDAV